MGGSGVGLVVKAPTIDRRILLFLDEARDKDPVKLPRPRVRLLPLGGTCIVACRPRKSDSSGCVKA